MVDYIRLNHVIAGSNEDVARSALTPTIQDFLFSNLFAVFNKISMRGRPWKYATEKKSNALGKHTFHANWTDKIGFLQIWHIQYALYYFVNVLILLTYIYLSGEISPQNICKFVSTLSLRYAISQ